MGKFWSQPTRVESRDMVQLITFRTINSALWFVNNKLLEERILAYLAKYINKYQVKLYGFSMVGSHVHLLARFPKANRAAFCRDLGARMAEAVRILVENFRGGPLFARRYTCQYLPLDKDITKYFYYSALQAVESGLAERISDYPGYNSFHDASLGIKRTYKFFRYGDYNDARRKNSKVPKKSFWEYHELSYERLPEFKSLNKHNYRKTLLSGVEARRAELVTKRTAEGKSFLGRERLRKVTPGSFPRSPKTGGVRPIALSICAETKRKVLQWYFSVVAQYRLASEAYRNGDFNVSFPEGTYRPNGACIGAT